ncbi:hypothetical protein SAM_1727 [Streptococcus agalactiae CJB111]|nr:hypothetical protein SAK_1769 [Streptococcus agalactiae A909]EAO73320.1 hypothetical protein SAM_1727 [Streptococcus agalactiae CJB111]CCQ83086.1 hypothetical protein GBS1014_1597 [Streptococcus agalactiae SS1014]
MAFILPLMGNVIDALSFSTAFKCLGIFHSFFS